MNVSDIDVEMTSEIRGLMNRRNQLRRRWRRCKNENNYKLYKIMRNQVQAVIRKAKQDYYMSVFSNTKDPSDIWRKLKHLGLIRSKLSDRKLLFYTDELNSFFLTNSNSNTRDTAALYLRDEFYKDTKFYWQNIEFGDICYQQY